MTSVSEPSPGTWTVDPSHTEVGFVARHLMVSKVRGQFKEFEATIIVADSFDTSSVQATVQLASIDTGSADRDTHLTSADFFDVESFPVMTFASTSVSADKLAGRPHHQGRHPPGRLRPGVRRRHARPVGRHPRRLRGDHRDQPQGLRPELERRPRERRRPRGREGQDRPRRRAGQGLTPTAAPRPRPRRRRGLGAFRPGTTASSAARAGQRRLPGHLEGVVGQDHLGAGPPDRQQRLHDRAVAVDPALGGGRLDHRVLPRHLVGRDRHRGLGRHGRQDVEVGQRRLDHHQVGALGEVEAHLAQRLGRVGRVLLVGRPVALQGRLDRLPERAVEGRGVLGGVGQDDDVLVPGAVQRGPDVPDLAVHHPGRGRPRGRRPRPAPGPSRRTAPASRRCRPRRWRRAPRSGRGR